MKSYRLRRMFSRRLARVVGLSSMLLPGLYACTTDVVVEDGATGSGGSSTSTTSTADSTTVTSTNVTTTGQGGASTVATVSTGSGCVESTSTGGQMGPPFYYHYSMCLDDLNMPCPSSLGEAEMVIATVLAQDCCTGPNFDLCEWLNTVDCGPFPTSEGVCCFEISTTEDTCLVPGRPYTTESGALLATLRDGDAWCGEQTPRVDQLSPRARELLAQRWGADGLAEHASIASFARFALDLMAVGATPELIAGAHRAALDEIEHAQAALSLASAYAGHSSSPAAFPLPEQVATSDLKALAVATAREGCINETLCTLLAIEQLAGATDPAVRAVLARIVEDETRHAELAWQTVAWAIDKGGAEVRDAVAAVFAEAGQRADWPVPNYEHGDPNDPRTHRELAAHGQLDQRSAARAMARAWADVVEPCARALVSSDKKSARPLAAAQLRA